MASVTLPAHSDASLTIWMIDSTGAREGTRPFRAGARG
jgi:hypothetical protein